jgi:hypothetical protein
MADPIQPPQSSPSTTTPGIRTSEFWLTILGSVIGMVGQYQGVIPEPWGTVTATILTAVYTIARTILKK